MALKHWLDREGIVLLLAFVALTLILGTATVWVGIHSSSAWPHGEGGAENAFSNLRIGKRRSGHRKEARQQLRTTNNNDRNEDCPGYVPE